MLKAIIVDDEELAIDRLSDLLIETGKVEIKMCFLDPGKAYEYLRDNKVDAAFLDISLPGIDGLTLADQIMNIDSNIDVVFVTGYDEYAVKAFEINALDYLMKPVTEERLAKTIEKMVNKRSQKPKALGVRVICFGGFDIFYGEEHQSVKWRTLKAEEMLAFLIHNGNRNVSRDYLIEQLWEDSNPEKATDMLNVTTYYLRKALNAFGIKDCIKTNRNDIWLDVHKFSCDLYELEAIIKGNAVVNSANIKEIEKAIGYYRGGYLENKDYNWAIERREALQKSFVNCLAKISEYYFIKGIKDSAMESLKRILTLEPLQEKIHERLIKMYLTSENRAEAEKQYRLLEKLLFEELDVKPSQEVRRLMGYK